MNAMHIIDECRNIIQAAKSEIKVPEFSFGLGKIFSWDLYPTSTSIDGYGKLETKSRAKKICRSAYDNRENAVKQKAAVYANHIAWLVGENGFAGGVAEIVDNAIKRCAELLDGLGIKLPDGINVAAPVVELDKSVLVRELCEDVVDYEKPFTFNDYFPLYCDINEFEHETLNRLGMWVNKTEYYCDCLECIEQMLDTLNRDLRYNCKRVWVRYFPTSVSADSPVEALAMLGERLEQSYLEKEGVPNNFSEYCEAVREALDLWLIDIVANVNGLPVSAESTDIHNDEE